MPPVRALAFFSKTWVSNRFVQFNFPFLTVIRFNFRWESGEAFTNHSSKGERLRVPVLRQAIHHQAQPRHSCRQHPLLRFAWGTLPRIGSSQVSCFRLRLYNRFFIINEKNSTSEKGKKISILNFIILPEIRTLTRLQASNVRTDMQPPKPKLRYQVLFCRGILYR